MPNSPKPAARTTETWWCIKSPCGTLCAGTATRRRKDTLELNRKEFFAVKGDKAVRIRVTELPTKQKGKR